MWLREITASQPGRRVLFHRSLVTRRLLRTLRRGPSTLVGGGGEQTAGHGAHCVYVDGLFHIIFVLCFLSPFPPRGNLPRNSKTTLPTPDNRGGASAGGRRLWIRICVFAKRFRQTKYYILAAKFKCSFLQKTGRAASLLTALKSQRRQ